MPTLLPRPTRTRTLKLTVDLHMDPHLFPPKVRCTPEDTALSTHPVDMLTLHHYMAATAEASDLTLEAALAVSELELVLASVDQVLVLDLAAWE